MTLEEATLFVEIFHEKAAHARSLKYQFDKTDDSYLYYEAKEEAFNSAKQIFLNLRSDIYNTN